MRRRTFFAVWIMASIVLSLNVMANSETTYPSQTTGSANFGGKKFYINPGHGGHDSDDRPTTMPCGVEMFYESDGNLDRAFHLKDFLVANNANVRMSRTKNTSSDDLGLSTIASYANSYGGYFISLHSNGANASANYMVSFYRTTSAAPNTEKVTGSKAMATAVSKWHDAVTLSDQTYSTPRALGDYSFYKFNLGVLKTNNRPGYLVETWFHDYRPESLRMKSTVYNKFLAWQIARAAMESPGATGNIEAVVMGDIRDLSKSCGYTNYTTRNRDKYKAVEGATVKLLNSQGVELQSMETDQCENGFYAFFVKETGKYTIEVSKGGYKTNTKDITISALSTQQMCNFNMEAGEDKTIKVNPATIDFGEVAFGSTSSIEISVTGSSLTDEITITSDSPEFKISPTTLPASGGSLNVSFTSEAVGSFTGTITLTSGTVTKTMVASATVYSPPLELMEVWNYSETSGVNKEWTEDKTVLRNMCYGDGKLFVVKPSDNSEVLIINARTGEKIGVVNTEGVSGGVYSIMDVQYVDGKLIATNLATNTSPLKVYVWSNGVNKAPTLLLNTSEIAGFSRIGDTFSIKGDLTNGAICYAAGGTSEQNKIVMYTIKDGVVSSTPETLDITADGTTEGGLVLGVSPRVVPDPGIDKYWVMGQNYYPSLVSAEGLLESTVNQEALKNVVYGNAFTIFTFKGASYAFATTYLPDTETSTGDKMTGGRAVLLDGSNGWASAEKIGEYPSGGLGITNCTTFSGNVVVNVEGDEYVEMWVLVNKQGIAYYRYESASESAEIYPEIAPEGISLEEEYSFTTDFELAQVAELTGKTVRRAIMREGLFYVLALDSNNMPYIYVVDPETQTVKSTLSTNGVVMNSAGGGTGVDGYDSSLQLPISDIAFTADGYLLACNYTINQDVEMTNVVDKGYFRVYKWSKDLVSGAPFGDPVEFVKTENNGFWNYGKVGYSFTVNGSLSDCEILTGAVTTGSSAQIRFVRILCNNEGGIISYKANDARLGTSPFTGEKYQLNVSPLDNSCYVIDGISTAFAPTAFAVVADESSATGFIFEVKNTMSVDVTPALSYFKYSGNMIMATPTIDANGAVDGVSWSNLSSSFTTPASIETDITITPIKVQSYATVGAIVKENYMHMYLLTDDKISRFVCKVQDYISPRGQYAYNLNMTVENDTDYTFTFDMTGDAPEAYIVLTSVTDENKTIEYAINEVKEGTNKVTIDMSSEILDDNYYWAVKVNSGKITDCGRYFTSSKTLRTSTKGGVSFVKDTESDAFGKIVVSNGFCQGIDVYSPTQKLESTTAYIGDTENSESTYRVVEHEGVVYIADSDDLYSGIYKFNPASPSTLEQWYNGTRGTGGIFTNSAGSIIGGGAKGLDIYGKGNNAKMYVFCEDYPKANSNGRSLICYNFGGASSWNKIPDAIYPNAKAKLANYNVEILATENGLFCTQVRSYSTTSSNDAPECPSLIYVDHNDNILFNSGDTNFFGSSAGSIAMNEDLSMMAFATQHRGIVVYSVTWKDNVPSFTEMYEIPNSISSGSNKICSQLDFDIAGNLHAFFETDGYCMFVLPNDNSEAITAAKKEQIVEGSTLTKLENVEIETNEPIEYYNLQGVRVMNPEKGIFIKKQGAKTQKVIL